MESTLALLHGDTQLLTEYLPGAVIRHLEIVDASHDRREVVVGRVWWLCWLADHCKHGCETLEACKIVSDCPRKYQPGGLCDPRDPQCAGVKGSHKSADVCEDLRDALLA